MLREKQRLYNVPHNKTGDVMQNSHNVFTLIMKMIMLVLFALNSKGVDSLVE